MPVSITSDSYPVFLRRSFRFLTLMSLDYIALSVKMLGNGIGTKLQNSLSYLKDTMIRVRRTLKRLKHDVDSRGDGT